MIDPDPPEDAEPLPVICPVTGSYCEVDGADPSIDCEGLGCARQAGIDVNEGDDLL